MLMEDLLERRFDAYFAAMRAGNPLWVFVHIPKTAGTSMNRELWPVLKPFSHLFIDYTQLDRRSFNELLDERVRHFIDEAAEKKFRFCTGHILAEHVDRIAAALPDVRPITLLRDPVSRFVSDYRYQCSAGHPGHEAFLERHPTIDSYLELQGEWNKSSTHLLPPDLRSGHDIAAAIDYVFNRYAFIGLQEHYALSLRLVSTLIGAPRRPTLFFRVNKEVPEEKTRLSIATEARIRACNGLDIQLYDAVASRVRAVAPALKAYLDEIAPLPD